jgi:glucosamine-6-phosphate isomerase
MEIKVFEGYQGLSAAAAEIITNCVRVKPDALLCFATGDTPRLTYQLAVEIAKKDRIDFSQCFITGLDEWLGIPPDNTGSCHYFLHEYFLRPMNINLSQVFLFDAMTTDEENECEKMNRIIVDKGGIDLMVAGVGLNGHIGFNEPGTAFDSIAHVAVLDETTTTTGQKYFGEKVAIGKGITMGLRQVMQAKKLLMMANGKKKAPVIKRAVEKEASIHFPASLIQQHKNGLLMTDTEAASELETQLR